MVEVFILSVLALHALVWFIGWVTATDIPFAVCFWALPVWGKRLYGVWIIPNDDDFKWDTTGTWAFRLAFGQSRYRSYSGEWARKGRVVVFWTYRKRKPQTKFKPGFSLG